MATHINNNFDLGSDAISEVNKIKFGIVVSNWNNNITDNLFQYPEDAPNLLFNSESSEI